jgi:hypothetical protein
MRSQLGSRWPLPLSSSTGGSSPGSAMTGRTRKLPPLWSTLNQGPSGDSTGMLNRTTPPTGSAKTLPTSTSLAGRAGVPIGTAYSSGVSAYDTACCLPPAAYEQDTTMESCAPAPGTVAEARTYRLSPVIGPECSGPGGSACGATHSRLRFWKE